MKKLTPNKRKEELKTKEMFIAKELKVDYFPFSRNESGYMRLLSALLQKGFEVTTGLNIYSNNKFHFTISKNESRIVMSYHENLIEGFVDKTFEYLKKRSENE